MEKVYILFYLTSMRSVTQKVSGCTRRYYVCCVILRGKREKLLIYFLALLYAIYYSFQKDEFSNFPALGSNERDCKNIGNIREKDGLVYFPRVYICTSFLRLLSAGHLIRLLYICIRYRVCTMNDKYI